MKILSTTISALFIGFLAQVEAGAVISLDNKEVTSSELEAAIPNVVLERVPLLDYPGFEHGDVMAYLDEGSAVTTPHMRTNEIEVKDGRSGFWYLVQGVGAENDDKMGWVFGSNLGFNTEPDESRLRYVSVVSKKELYRAVYVKEIYSAVFGQSGHNIPATWIEDKAPIENNDTSLWYLSEYMYHTYKTESGEVRLLYKDGESSFSATNVLVNKPLTGVTINVGDSIEKVHMYLGEYYHVGPDNTLHFDRFYMDEAFFLIIKLDDNNVVTEVQTQLFFG